MTRHHNDVCQENLKISTPTNPHFEQDIPDRSSIEENLALRQSIPV
jgi:hypothetical protein